jgi:hypothetical protein
MIQPIPTPSPVHLDPDPLLSDAQIAKLLGVTPRVVRSLRKHRGLPHVHLTQKVIRTRQSDFHRWLGSNLVVTG